MLFFVRTFLPGCSLLGLGLVVGVLCYIGAHGGGGQAFGVVVLAFGGEFGGPDFRDAGSEVVLVRIERRVVLCLEK